MDDLKLDEQTISQTLNKKTTKDTLNDNKHGI